MTEGWAIALFTATATGFVGLLGWISSRHLAALEKIEAERERANEVERERTKEVREAHHARIASLEAVMSGLSSQLGKGRVEMREIKVTFGRAMKTIERIEEFLNRPAPEKSEVTQLGPEMFLVRKKKQ